MTISAKVICDSFGNDCRLRITTLELEYPRFIHSEFMTHRVFSRNASSSRAIPVQKMIGVIKLNPAMPIHWGQNQSGMQANEELTGLALQNTQTLWMEARDNAIEIAEQMLKLGAHKQIVNRILEPFSHIRVIVTATDFANFFALRDHPDAQPEIRELAQVMKEAMDNSEPVVLNDGEWHLPYLAAGDFATIYNHLKKGSITRDKPSDYDTWMLACAVSAARCARVSYLTHDGERPTLEKDLGLYHMLVNANPPHMSPCEHQATPDKRGNPMGYWLNGDRQGNFTGWIQFRHLIKDESVKG